MLARVPPEQTEKASLHVSVCPVSEKHRKQPKNCTFAIVQVEKPSLSFYSLTKFLMHQQTTPGFI